MHRRDFLRVAGVAFSTSASTRWRTFELSTRVEVLKPEGVTRIWVPAALDVTTPYQKTLARTVECGGGRAKVVQQRTDGLAMVCAEFDAGVRPVLTVTNKVATRDRAANLNAPGIHNDTEKYWLRSTKLMPIDGIVKEKATAITAGARTDVEKARAIYEWILENTYRNPQTRGCGNGNIRYMLESNELGGKCADINALYVGLARAAGLPARDVYGIRVAKSDLGYKSLGPASENVTKAQHCRAEVYLREYGWVAVDPADVRKVMLEEPPGNRGNNDEMVQAARRRLFGSWEMNWVAYNFANDVVLPGSSGAPVGFFMYPQAETSEGRLDSLNPDSFRYEILAREIKA